MAWPWNQSEFMFHSFLSPSISSFTSLTHLSLRNGVVLSGTHWTPEQLENWLYTQCWATGYAHFDAIKKQQLKERILHAINQLKIWNEAVGICDDPSPSNRKREKEDRDRGACVLLPPMAWGGKTLSAHDAMGGGEVVGGGDSALSSGWTPATGQWPGRDQALRSPPPPPTWNVVDWADGKLSTPTGKGPGSDKERKMDLPRSRPASRSRAPSRAPSGHEIFIPESGDEGDGWLHVTDPVESYRGRSPQQGAGQSSVRDQQRIYLKPNHAPNTNRPSSRQHSRDPYNGIYGPPKGKGLENLGSTLAGPLNAFEYGSPPHVGRLGHHRTQSHAVPTSYQDIRDPDFNRKAALRHAQAEKMRRKKEKDRKRTKDIGKARSSKWAPRHWFGEDAPVESSSDMDDSEEESEESTDEEDDIHDSRRGRDSRGSQKRSSGNGHQHHDPHDANGWQTYSYGVGHAPTPGGSSLHPPAHYQPSGSRPSSRNASPGRMKKRPPPLALSPPPVIPSLGLQHNTAPANPARSRHPNDANMPTRLPGAAERAQYQFEQQQRDYQRQLVMQSHQPTVRDVAQRVAEQISAQQASAYFHQTQAQQSFHHTQGLRGAASWAQPHQPIVGGNHHQPLYHHHHQQQQHHHHQQRLRPTMTEIYH